tara:strand:- start:295 stop:429 length:135 start_codon:yes stop_codon:yes gene_type:complete
MAPNKVFNLLACEKETMKMAISAKKKKTSVLTKACESIFPAFMQ